MCAPRTIPKNRIICIAFAEACLSAHAKSKCVFVANRIEEKPAPTSRPFSNRIDSRCEKSSLFLSHFRIVQLVFGVPQSSATIHDTRWSYNDEDLSNLFQVPLDSRIYIYKCEVNTRKRCVFSWIMSLLHRNNRHHSTTETINENKDFRQNIYSVTIYTNIFCLVFVAHFRALVSLKAIWPYVSSSGMGPFIVTMRRRQLKARCQNNIIRATNMY